MEVKKEEQTLEESFASLDKIIVALEGRDISLEDSFKVYQSGMELIKSCNEKIDTVEKNMQMINENGELNEF